MIYERVKWILEFSLINNHYLICAFWKTPYLEAGQNRFFIAF